MYFLMSNELLVKIKMPQSGCGITCWSYWRISLFSLNNIIAQLLPLVAHLLLILLLQPQQVLRSWRVLP